MLSHGVEQILLCISTEPMYFCVQYMTSHYIFKFLGMQPILYFASLDLMFMK